MSRATVSVIAARGRVRHLAALASALARTFGEGVERASRAVAAVRAGPGGRGMTDTVLVLAWLVLAHLVADFVLQNDWIAINKATGGRNGWAALSVHGFHVGLCLCRRCSRSGCRGSPT